MNETKRPTLKNGKICYIEIPTNDLATSVAFYSTVFGWTTRKRSNGKIAFDDTVNEVSGTWITEREPSTQPGILIYILVGNVESTLDLIISNGGKIIQAIGKDAPEITARFSDPSGNVFGIFQQ